LDTNLNWRRSLWIAAGVLSALVLLFHRPLLFAIADKAARHFAFRENLHAEFRLEGNPFGSLTVRNVHVFPTGPSDVESIDISSIHIDYSLITMLRHGISAGLRNVEIRSANIVLNPAKAPLRPRAPDARKEMKLPDIFPERIYLEDVSVIVRNRPHDFVLEHAFLNLNPTQPGELTIGRLQLVGGQTWSKLSAQTQCADRNLSLQNLSLGDNEQLRSFSVDASQIASRKLTIAFAYVAAAGHVSGTIAAQESQSSLQTNVRIEGANLPLSIINKYAALPDNFIQGELAIMDLNISGLLSSPQTWSGTAHLQINNLRQENTSLDRIELSGAAERGQARIEAADIYQRSNELHLRGLLELPQTASGFGRTPTSLEIAASIPDLATVTAGMPQHATGSARFRGKVDIRNGKANANLSLVTAEIGLPDGSIEKISGDVTVSKSISRSNSKQPWFDQLQTTASLTIGRTRVGEYAIDSAEVVVRQTGDAVSLDRALVQRKTNQLSLTGSYRLPTDLRQALAQAATVNVSLTAPNIGDYWNSDTADRPTGPLQLYGQIDWRNRAATGAFSVFATELQFHDLTLHQVSVQAAVYDNVVYLNDFTAALNQQDYIAATAIVDSNPPFAYRGRFVANLVDLSVFNPVLSASGNHNAAGGSLIVSWSGNGAIQRPANQGELHLALDNGRYGPVQGLQAKVEAAYSRDGFNAPIIFLRSDKMDFQAVAQTRGNTIEVDKIQLNQGSQKYADGYVSIPFVWQNLRTGAPIFPSDGAVSVSFQTENLDIKKIFEDLGVKAPASGTLNMRLGADGTLSQLRAKLELQMRDVRTAAIASLDPAKLELTAEAQDGQLNIVGNVQQPKIQPISLTAKLPLPLRQILNQRKIPDDTPVTAHVRMPRSSVNFVRQFVPAIQELDGDAGLDVDVKGTLRQPVLSGSVDLTINVGRFANPTLPALQSFKARLVFNRDTLNFQQFGGELAGGPFSVSGRISFANLTEPNLDLQLKAISVLVARNDSLTARADAEVRVSGALNSASVSGTVALTDSHFLKNLDLVPIGLPGRPAPQPPASRPELSFPTPPLRDWKFDIAIKTKDPFLIRGSIANGGAAIDLHLGGTGLHPALEGQVRMENVEATLPFSRLDVQYGFLYFDPSDPLNPKIDLHGTSVVRDYTIHVYVYGRSVSPEAVFTSEPPLPQEEIISLLATGTTREALTGNNNVLAGRAAMLLFQQLYRKVFKKGENTKSNSVFDRLDVDFGQVDPRTGQQTASARFKINQQLVLVGDIEVGGDFRGMVKYLIRFR
jgi:hypothetical protein